MDEWIGNLNVAITACVPVLVDGLWKNRPPVGREEATDCIRQEATVQLPVPGPRRFTIKELGYEHNYGRQTAAERSALHACVAVVFGTPFKKRAERRPLLQECLQPIYDQRGKKYRITSPSFHRLKAVESWLV